MTALEAQEGASPVSQHPQTASRRSTSLSRSYVANRDLDYPAGWDDHSVYTADPEPLLLLPEEQGLLEGDLPGLGVSGRRMSEQKAFDDSAGVHRRAAEHLMAFGAVPKNVPPDRQIGNDGIAPAMEEPGGESGNQEGDDECSNCRRKDLPRIGGEVGSSLFCPVRQVDGEGNLKPAEEEDNEDPAERGQSAGDQKLAEFKKIGLLHPRALLGGKADVDISRRDARQSEDKPEDG